MNLEAGTAQRTQSDAAYWLNSRLTFCSLSYTARAHLPRDGTTNSGLGPPISNQRLRKCPTDMPSNQSSGGTSQLRVPLLGVIKLPTEASNDRVSCSPCCPGNHYVTEADLELLVLLPLPPMCCVL